MGVVRLNFLPRFDLGQDALLLSLGGSGLNEFQSLMRDAYKSGAAKGVFGEFTHEIIVDVGVDAAEVELTPVRAVWRLGESKIGEICENLAVLRTPRASGRTAGHFYVDFSFPAKTLVMSYGEYDGEIFPWVDPPKSA